MGYGSDKTLLNLKTVSIILITIVIRMIISTFLKLIYKLGKCKIFKRC